MKLHMQHRDEQGAVMVLIALTLIVFLVMAALAIDTVSLAASAEQARFAAKYSALRALETYVSAVGTKEQRLDKALEAANAAGTLNLVMAGTKGADAFSGTNTEGTDGEELTQPVLVAGRYYAAENPTKGIDGSTCTVGICGAGKQPPCFLPLDDVGVVNAGCDPLSSGDPNAFQIVGPYFSGIRKWIASSFAPGSFSVNVDEVAAVVPRHTCFLVDISTSMAQETHYEYSAAPEKSVLAYFLSGDNGAVKKTTNPNDADDNVPWSALEPNRATAASPPAPSSVAYKRVHYQDDYSTPITILNDSDYQSKPEYQKYHPDPSVTNPKTLMKYTSGTEAKKFRVDKRYFENPAVFSGTTYSNGPEPFTTVFRALNNLVTKFKERSVVGDKVCLIFFDNKLEWPRIINLTSDFDYLTKFTDLSQQGPDVGWQLIFKHGIFPIRNRDSNMKMAMAEALNQFSAAQESSVPSIDQMVMFGDGISNCTTCTSGADPKCVPYQAGPGCGDDYGRYRVAVNELHDFAAKELFPRRIRLDFFLMGSHVLPNHWLIGQQKKEGDPVTCVSDSEARQSQARPADRIEYVDGGNYPTFASAQAAYAAKSESTPFLMPNSDMYPIVRLLGGSWVPIMAYDPNANCEPACSLDTTERQSTSCSSPTQQVDAAIEEIMGSNPYTIVKHQ